ncbi:peptide deformylase [Patescibacteria group bacterium]|nr:MAG: peptide deformylase [Patescibacteria group bacterium]
MPKIVIQEPAPVLRRKSEKFEKIGSREAKKLVFKMLETMKEKRGVGIAAPQINEGVQAIIVDTADGPLALYNPKLLKTSKKKESGEEGCLSVAGVYGIVPRFTSVEVEAQNEKAEIVRIKAEGFFARVLQHEIDHINGVLFIDRATKITEGKKILDEIENKAAKPIL